MEEFNNNIMTFCHVLFSVHYIMPETPVYRDLNNIRCRQRRAQILRKDGEGGGAADRSSLEYLTQSRSLKMRVVGR